MEIIIREKNRKETNTRAHSENIILTYPSYACICTERRRDDEEKRRKARKKERKKEKKKERKKERNENERKKEKRAPTIVVEPNRLRRLVHEIHQLTEGKRQAGKHRRMSSPDTQK